MSSAITDTDPTEITYEPEPEIPQDHLLTLANLKYQLTLPIKDAQKKQIVQEMMDIIENQNMVPYHKYLKKDHAIANLIPALSNQSGLETDIQNKLKELDDKIKDAEENLGENEVREGNLAKAQYYHQIGDKDAALSAYRLTQSKTVALGQKLDNVFAMIRIGFAFSDKDLIRRSIDVAKSMIEEGGDWERRNRLKVYEGTYLMSIREFQGASKLFLESVSTFSATEMFNYKTFIFYTIIVGIISLERPDLKKKIIESSDILSVIKEIAPASDFLNSLYNGNYHQFLVALAEISEQMKKDRFLVAHIRYYSREMRIYAYQQFLESYKSVTLDSIANQFGLSVEFIDKELSRFIAAGRLPAKIDKVGGIIESTQRDAKNAQYHTIIKHGDLLLNRIQKLSRVIDL
jgi:26S proteasome regulatory subunit N7